MKFPWWAIVCSLGILMVLSFAVGADEDACLDLLDDIDDRPAS